MAREPGYRLHKPSGQAYVNLGGKVFYLGKHGTPESLQRYSALKAEWLVNRHVAKFVPEPQGVTLCDLCNAFLDHAETYYKDNPSECYHFELAITPICELYPLLPIAKFGPLEFRAVRKWWLDRRSGKDKLRRCSRQYINKIMRRLRQIVRWAVGQAMAAPSLYEALRHVEPLKLGRTEAPEAKGMGCVDQTIVDGTLPFLPQVVADMVRFQQLTGCRPGEVCAITPSMVDRSQEIWTVTLNKHKTAWRGKRRSIFVGPKAQSVLLPYLLRAADQPCFSPREADIQRRKVRHESRQTPLSCGNRPGSNSVAKPSRRPGIRYTTGSYGNAIRYACRRAKLSEWSPNQLRHNRATIIRKGYGIEAASAALGHSGLKVTEVYAEADKEKVLQVAREIG